MNVRVSKGRIHVVVGDTQVKPGVPTEHLDWIGRYVVDQFAGQDITWIHLGDHWDMPSLSSYDKGTLSMEGRRYRADIEAGNAGWRKLNRALVRYNAKRRPSRQWWPDRRFYLGNHEDRITRACNENAQLDGVISLRDIGAYGSGWKVVPFLKPEVIDGVSYAHYFYHPFTGRSYGGENLHLRLKTIGRSFTMGHQQGLNVAVRAVGDVRHHGLVLGSSYLHDEKYMGHQGNNYWRGIVVCHQVERGMYDSMHVSLDFLCRKYRNETLKTFLKRKSCQTSRTEH